MTPERMARLQAEIKAALAEFKVPGGRSLLSKNLSAPTECDHGASRDSNLKTQKPQKEKSKMNELIEALTRWANASAALNEHALNEAVAGGQRPVEVLPTKKPEAAAAPAPVKEPKAPKEKKDKAPAPAKAEPGEDLLGATMGGAAPAATAEAPAKVPGLTPEQSSNEAIKVATEYVKRFANPAEGSGQQNGQVRARAILTTVFGKARITDLVHEERLKFIAQLKAEIAQADQKVPVGAAAGVDLGIPA